MRVTVQFDQKWIFDPSGRNSLAARKLVSLCQDKFGRGSFETDDLGITGVTLDMKDMPDQEGPRVKASIKEMVEELAGSNVSADQICTIRLDSEREETKPVFGPASGQAEAKGQAPQAGGESAPVGESPAQAPNGPVENAGGDSTRRERTVHESAWQGIPEQEGEERPLTALERAENLVGAAHFKALVRRILQTAPVIRGNHTEQVFRAESYLFAVNGGSGFSTSLDILAQLLDEEALSEAKGRARELSLPAPEDQEVKNKMGNLIKTLPDMMRQFKVLSIDVTPWVGHTNQKEFKALLLEIFRQKPAGIVLFRSPLLEEKELKRLTEDLNDLMSVELIRFEPFTREETHELASRLLAEYKLTAQPSAWASFDEDLAEEMSDGYFYGIHTITKVTNRMIRRAELFQAQNQRENIVIDEQSLVKEAAQAGSRTALEQLNAMIGMAPVKATVISILDQITAARQHGLPGTPAMHMRFDGNPGTGKTTVARLVGQILKENGILRVGKFFEHHGRDLCGQYVGETKIKTHAICEEAYGSVLFIDEAYSLYRGAEGSVRDYGREALDTLIAEMENHADDLLVILAGYPADMDTLMHGNAGLSSRVPYKVVFPDFSREELAQIYRSMIPDKVEISADFDQSLDNFFTELPDTVFKAENFGNGRFVRNLYERTFAKAAPRYVGKPDEPITLVPEDLTAAAEEIIGNLKEAPKKVFGFH